MIGSLSVLVSCIGLIQGIELISKEWFTTEMMESNLQVEKEYSNISRLMCSSIATRFNHKLYCYVNQVCKISDQHIIKGQTVSASSGETILKCKTRIQCKQSLHNDDTKRGNGRVSNSSKSKTIV